MESTPSIIIVAVENASFGYDLTIGNLVNMGSRAYLLEDPLTWGIHLADESGCEAVSLLEKTRNRQEIMNNQCS